MPPPDWKSAIEVFPAAWACPAEPFWVAGWITSPALVPVDMRATLGGRVFLGLCGMPRTDPKTGVRDRAGFCFLLQPDAGATEIRIEVCDQHSRWTEIFRHAVTSSAAAPAPAAPPPPGPRALLRLLQTRQARPHQSWATLAREVLAAEDAVPLDVLPSPPFYGALEQLGAEASVRYNHLLVTGWLAHRTQHITRLTAFLDTAAPLPLAHGLSRPDAVKFEVDLVASSTSRFAGHLELPPHAPHPLALRIFADLEDGSHELVFARRFRPVVISGADFDLPPDSTWTFARAAWALWQAGWGDHWPSGTLVPVLKAARLEYAAAAPRPLTPNLTPAETAPVTRPLHVTVVTHNLNLEGAPLIAFEYARHLASQPGWRVRVISPQDGPLRAMYAAAGLAVELVDVKPALTAGSVGEFHRRLQQLADDLRLGETDLIAANTMVSFWAVLLAHRLRKPSILYTHESVSVRRFFAPELSRELITEAESAFACATRVVFSAAASQKVHGRAARHDHFRVIPGWIDVARIENYYRANPREEIRRKLGLPADAVVFANIGTVSVRKGQQVFVDAVTALLRTPPAGGRELVFLMVGARTGPDPYIDLLRRTISERGLTGARIVDQVSDSYAYYRAADIFVCSSFEEAFPRVLMEAAVCGMPIVTTNVNGIPEMLGPDDAWLVPPGDAAQLASAMREALAAHLAGDRRRALHGRVSVTTKFDSAVLLPRHLATVCAVAELPVA
jgi:glycosyltransferase involved in cell wall biosynthesis